MTYLTMYGYNFCWATRTLRVKDGEGHWRGRSPAMAAGLTDHLWTWGSGSLAPSLNQRGTPPLRWTQIIVNNQRR